jgi:hypothetical protein
MISPTNGDGCGEHECWEEGLTRHHRSTGFLSSQESFQEILAFLFEVIRLGCAFEQIADGFIYVLSYLLLDPARQGVRI